MPRKNGLIEIVKIANCNRNTESEQAHFGKTGAARLKEVRERIDRSQLTVVTGAWESRLP